MPPRTRRGAPRGGAAASRASAAASAAPVTPKEETPAQPPSLHSIPSDTPAPAPAPPQPPAARPSAALPSSSAAAAAAARSFALKPKVVRRADEERKALAEQEEKKFHDRAAEDARRRRASSRGRGRGGRGRGRGDFGGGRDGLVRRTVAPEGPFSQVPGAAARGGSMRGPGGGGFSAGGGGGFGAGGGGRGGGDGGHFSSVAAGIEYDPRLNTDIFNGRAGDYDDAKDEHGGLAGVGDASSSSAAAKAPKKEQLLPMGIRREEHREPEVIVATTAELEAADREAAAAAGLPVEESSDADLFFENSAAVEDDGQVWSRAIKTQGVKIVGADGQEVEVTEIDTLAEKRRELAEAAARASGATVKAEADDDSGPSLDSLSEPPAGQFGQPGQPKVAKKKAVKPEKKDPEDVAMEEGLQAMLHDLAMDAPRVQVGPGADAGMGGDTLDEEQKQQPRREGRLFLFQFPPVLPSLKAFEPSADSGDTRPGGGVKQEPGAEDDLVMMDGVAPAPIDLTGSDGGNGNDINDIGGGGFLGRLNIRQSGRAELSWGGMTYEMMPGTDVQFLTTAVLLEDSDEKRKPGEGGNVPVGNAFGMGSVGGKYNLVPVFSDETDWVVDPSELVVDEEM